MNDAGKKKKLSELAAMVQGEIAGGTDPIIYGVADLDSAGPGEIAFVDSDKKSERMISSNASAFIVPRLFGKSEKPVIMVRDPLLAVALIHNYFISRPFSGEGISPEAHIGPDCRIPPEVSIAPGAVLGCRVVVGKRVKIYPGVVVGDDVTIGSDTILHANVTIGDRCLIGDRVVIHGGTVIGSDGFGYSRDEDGRYLKRPQVGIVRIDDDVEIGANVCVDRATFGETRIKNGVKIDNLVQVAHNVEIGENTLLVSQVGIAGSAVIGKGVVMGGQAGIKGHIKLEDGVMVAAKSGVHNSQKSGAVVSGIPAVPHRTWLKSAMIYPKLPELVKDIRAIKKKLSEVYEMLAVMTGNK